MGSKQFAIPTDPAVLATGVTKTDSSAILNVDEAVGDGEEPGTAEWGFPRPKGQSLSYWLQQVRGDELLDHRTTQELPATADTVIIGSGVSMSDMMSRLWAGIITVSSAAGRLTCTFLVGVLDHRDARGQVSQGDLARQERRRARGPGLLLGGHGTQRGPLQTGSVERIR